MIQKIAIGFVVMIGVLLIFILAQPSEFQVVRSIEIDAPPAVVFAILNDLHQGKRWSPYEKLDPNMQQTFSGPETGVGSIYTWDGNDHVGAGRLEITQSLPNELVAMDLSFTRPFEAENKVHYKLVPIASGTQVSWVMEGRNNFTGKVVCMFMNMDKMVGKDFEQGLADLKLISEDDAKQPSRDDHPDNQETSPDSPAQ